MKTNKVDYTEAMKNKFNPSYRLGKLQAIIENFVNSEDECWELIPDEGEYASVMGLYSNMFKALKRAKCKTVKPVKRGDRVYLIRIKIGS